METTSTIESQLLTADTATEETKEIEETGVAANRKRRGGGAVLMLAVGCMLAGLVLVGPGSVKKADAATWTSTVVVCFRQQGGGAFTGPVTSQIYTNQGWVNYMRFPGTNSGCERYLLADGYYWRFQVNHRLGQSSWFATTGYVYARPYQNYHLGTYTVSWNVRY